MQSSGSQDLVLDWRSDAMPVGACCLPPKLTLWSKGTPCAMIRQCTSYSDAPRMCHRSDSGYERWYFESSDQEPVDCSGLLQAIALHCQVEVAVVFDRVAVGVEQGGVPVAESLVPLGAVER